MNRYYYILLFFFFLGNFSLSAQTELGPELRVKDTIKKNEINMLAPSKAAFYSAVLPGLGQIYNKKYWKVPLVYGALGTTIYFYISNNNKYHAYRDAYKRRLEGFNDDEFTYLDNSRLITAQKFYQNNRDLSALLTGLFYILNIVDANVDAHLMQFNVNDNLTIKPDFYRNDFSSNQNLGICVTWKL
ncbi:MAG: hypothetical protein RIQ59_695 [Bacteroidota bacterium]